jgi:hypothetical protein
MNCSVSKATWGKYASGMRAFEKFEEHFCKRFQWPLAPEVIRAFVVWCTQSKGLQQATIRGYIAAIKFVHHIKGLSCKQLDQDPVTALLLRGSMHLTATKGIHSTTRRVVTFPLLLTIGHRIASSNWDPLSKQVVWTTATTAFFGSARLGELLACEEGAHSPSSDLTWRDVAISSESSLLIRIKQPKTGSKEGEYIDLFKFSGFGCCPVKALYALKKKQIEAGVFELDSPVFRFRSKKNLTMSRLNSVLGTLLEDMCAKGENSVTCHSFRAGIPSCLSAFPDLANSEDIKGWGRWQSDCYERYTRMKLPQRMRIFSKISTVLQATQAKN